MSKLNDEDLRAALQQLNKQPVEMVPDYSKSVTKDLPVDRINTKGEINPLKTAPDFTAQQIINEAHAGARKRDMPLPENIYDAGAMKSQYQDKAQSGKKIFGTKAPVDLDYNSFRKNGLQKIAGKTLKAIPLIGAALSGYAALQAPDASAAVGDAVIPGGLDSTGPQQGSYDQRLEQGQLTSEEKQNLLTQQARIKALQNMGQ